MPIYKPLIPSPERLAEAGLADIAAAARNLEALGARIGPDAEGLYPILLSHLSRSADPDLALNNLERFFAGSEDADSFVRVCRERSDILSALVIAMGASRFLATVIISRSDGFLDLLADPTFLPRRRSREQHRSALEQAVGDSADDTSFYRALRTYRRQELLRIGIRDLQGRAGLQDIVGDLSDLADACLQAAYERSVHRLRERHGRPMIDTSDGSSREAGFSVIAMGKLGGQELNFSSDVDLMYVYEADGETEGAVSVDGMVTNRISNHQFFVKLAERISAAIGERTEDGFVFRVDLRLRPEGQRGPLAQSLGGYEIYYESWGQTWERSALIKARPVAGDEAVGREFIERVTPFVYRKYLDYGAIHEIREMKQKINREVEQKSRANRDVKLGYGGIREIEFIIQAVQLIYGGRDRSLRERNAMKALHTLSQKGLITYQEQDVLSRAYVFLRNLEHRIQILDDQQTQTLPGDGSALRALARRMGFLETGQEEGQLLQAYREHTERVRSIYDDLFSFSGDVEPQPSAEDEFSALLDPELPEQEAVQTCAKLGFRSPAKAYRNLLMLREGAAFVHQTPRSRKLFRELFPSLFRLIIASSDPDQALHHLESFLATQGSWEAFHAVAGTHTSVPAVLVAVFANSQYLARALISRPQLMQNLAEARTSLGRGTARRLAEELETAMRGYSGVPEKLDALRRFKSQEEMRIGMADLLSGMDLRAVGRELSKLAEVCLDAVLALATGETCRRYTVEGRPSGFAVIGAGKLGGRELTYGSDLDILFVYDEAQADALPEGVTAFEFFSKIAERTISYLSTMTREGFLYRVDTRLRPTGSKGPLVNGVDAFAGYYRDQAQTWELQALLQTRCVAGDRRTGERLCSLIRNVLYRRRDGETLRKDIASMRARMIEELGKERSDRYNIKQGSGGIVDIEFIAQFLQLLHGWELPRLRITGTENVLGVLRTAGVLKHETATVLHRAYSMMRRLQSRLRIVANQSSSTLSRIPADLQSLARSMGFQGSGDQTAGDMLLSVYEREMTNVKSIYRSILEMPKSHAGT